MPDAPLVLFGAAVFGPAGLVAVVLAELDDPLVVGPLMLLPLVVPMLLRVASDAPGGLLVGEVAPPPWAWLGWA